MTGSSGGERERLIAECSHQFHRVFHAFWANASSAWLGLDLSITQLRNLIVLSLRGPQPVGGLAAALDVSEPSASQIVDRGMDVEPASEVEHYDLEPAQEVSDVHLVLKRWIQQP